MARFSVALEPVTPEQMTPELLGRLAVISRQPAAKWKDKLVAPQFGRLMLDFDSEKEAQMWATRIVDAGLAAHAVNVREIVNGIDETFEASFAEKVRDGMNFVAADGRELLVSSTDVRSILTGAFDVQGEKQVFLVIGLKGQATARDGSHPPAVLVRAPGAELSRIAPDAPTAYHAIAALFTVLSKLAPHARVDRSFESMLALPGSELLGTKDPARIAISTLVLDRLFADRAQRAAAEAQRRAAEAAARSPTQPTGPVVIENPYARKPGEKSRGSSSIGQFFGFVGRNIKVFGAIAGIAAIVMLGVKFAPVLLKFISGALCVILCELWMTLWGPKFTYDSYYLTKVGGIDLIGFAVTVEHEGKTETIRQPAHMLSQQMSFGTTWKITGYEELSSEKAGWIHIEAKKK